MNKSIVRNLGNINILIIILSTVRLYTKEHCKCMDYVGVLKGPY